MKKEIGSIVMVSACSLFSPSVHATYNGWATPTSITYNFSSLSLNNDSGTSSSLISTPFSMTFKRSDKDFASTTISKISVPFGRYVSVGLCSTGVVTINMNGVKYDGQNNSGGLNFGSTIYTAKSDNSVGSISTTGPAVDLTFTGGNGRGCSITYFPSPLCVTDSSQSSCKAGDLVYASGGAAKNSKGDGKGVSSATASFKINFLLDLYDSVTMDGTSAGMNVVLVPNVIAVIGDPGAAIHLTKHDATNGTVNASLLFGADKSLLTLFIAQAGGATGGSPLPHTCQGSNNVAITGASSNFPYSFLSKTTLTANSNTGQVLAPMASTCQSTSNCNSNGTEQIDGFIQAVGNNATLQCIADSSTAPSSSNSFGSPYVGGSGAPGGTETADIVRIVDPNNIFGVCASSPCFDTGITGSDGYY